MIYSKHLLGYMQCSVMTIESFLFYREHKQIGGSDGIPHFRLITFLVDDPEMYHPYYGKIVMEKLFWHLFEEAYMTLAYETT